MSESASTPTAAAEEQRAELPKEPLLPEETPAPNADVARNARPKIKAAAEEVGTSPEAEVSQAAAPGADGKVVIISERLKRMRQTRNTVVVEP